MEIVTIVYTVGGLVKTVLLVFLLSTQAYADPTGSSATSSGSADMSCSNSKNQKVCEDIDAALKDSCNQGLLDRLRQEAQNGSLQDSGEFCSNQTTIASDDTKWHNVVRDFMVGIALKESSGDPNAEAKGPSGQAKGYFQISGASTQGYTCCKGRFTSENEKDPKANALCGVGLNLQNMVNGNCWAHGGGGDASSCGAAKYQEVCRDSAAKDQASKDQIAKNCQKSCSSGGNDSIQSTLGTSGTGS